MTNEFAQQFSPSGVPLFGSNIASHAHEPYEPTTFTDITRRCIDAGMKNLIPQARVIEMRFTDPRTGWSQADDKVKVALCNAMNCYRRHLILPPLVTQTTLGGAMNLGAMFHANIRFGPGTPTTSNPGLTGADSALIMGGGSNSSYGLFTETTAINPVPLSAGGSSNAIVSISALTGSPTGIAGQVIIGYSGAVATIHSAIGSMGSGASASGNMNAATASCWGVLSTNVNSQDPGTSGHLMWCGTTLYYLANTSAHTDAPTPTLENIPSGGTAIGVDRLQKNWQNRAFWLWPRNTPNGSGLSSAQDPRIIFDVVSTSLEGLQPEYHRSSILNRVRGAVLWNQQLVQWDGMTVTVFDGETERDIQVMKGRDRNSDYRWGVSNVTVNGDELFIWMIRMDMTVSAGTLGVSELSMEKYIADGVFANFSATISAAQSNAGSVSTSLNRETINGEIDLMHQYSMGIPISRQTGFVHLNMYNSTKWDRFWVPQEGVNPYLHLNKTGASDEISQEFAATAFLDSNAFPIGNYHGLPVVAAGCSAAEMDIAAGGTAAQVHLSWYQQTGQTHTLTGRMLETFNSTDPLEKQTRFWLDNTSAFTLGKFRIGLTRGSDSHKTMNALPAIFYLIVYLDGKVRSPLDAGFTGWNPT